MLVNRFNLAEIFGCSVRTVARYIKSGMPVQPNGKIDTGRAVEWLVAREQRLGGYQSSKTRLAVATANLREAELDDKRAEMVTPADVRAECEKIFAIVRSRCEQIPGNVAQLVAAEIDAGAIEKLLGREVDRALAELSGGAGQ